MNNIPYRSLSQGIWYLQRVNFYKQHHSCVAKLTRAEIPEHLAANNHTLAGRKYLNASILKKMTGLEESGAGIGNIYLNPDKKIAFRTFISRPN
jgi:hypothetical protein